MNWKRKYAMSQNLYISNGQLVGYTVELVYYGHLGTSQQCPDYQGVLIFQVSLHDNVLFGTTAIGVWIMQVSTFSSVLFNRFHCIRVMHYNQNIHLYLWKKHFGSEGTLRLVSRVSTIACNHCYSRIISQLCF